MRTELTEKFSCNLVRKDEMRGLSPLVEGGNRQQRVLGVSCRIKTLFWLSSLEQPLLGCLDMLTIPPEMSQQIQGKNNAAANDEGECLSYRFEHQDH